MAFEETREQQQMYNYFRSCIYIFLILEIVMNLPITADNRVTQFVLELLGRFKVFNSVSGCKMAELVCICIVCIGTKAKKALKFNVRTMVIYPVLAGLALVGLCFLFHGMDFSMSWMGFPANRILYAICSVVGTMLIHQGLDAIAKYYKENGYLIDTHTAVAASVMEQYRKATGDKTVTVFVSTASPYKFCDHVLRAIGETPAGDGVELLDQLHETTGTAIPRRLAALKGKARRFDLTCEKPGMDSVVLEFLK